MTNDLTKGRNTKSLKPDESMKPVCSARPCHPQTYAQTYEINYINSFKNHNIIHCICNSHAL